MAFCRFQMLVWQTLLYHTGTLALENGKNLPSAVYQAIYGGVICILIGVFNQAFELLL